MADIQRPLSRLGLSQYAPIFIEHGFDSWQAILHITESDLDHLHVKLGHRRILQKEIAHARGVSFEQLTSPTQPNQQESGRVGVQQDRVKADVQADRASRGKRKYRRHPKNDENAPERPPSAYVIFSNKVREELKPLNLSFTEIAKRVGERWQNITSEEKGPHEKAATEMKENYHREMDSYKTTENCRIYAEYLADFKLKYSGSADDKRPKLDKEESKESYGSSGSTLSRENTDPSQAGASAYRSRGRGDSTGSTGPMYSVGGLSSPASVTSRPVSLRTGLTVIPSHSNASPSSTSPSSPSVGRDSSMGPTPATTLQPRPFIDTTADPASYSLGRSQPFHRNAPYRDGRPYQNDSSGPAIDRRLSRSYGTQSPVDEEVRPNRPIPKLVHQNTSSSSGMSYGSSVSNAPSGTTASSISTIVRGTEDCDRPQLPPLSATGLPKPGGSMADYALRSSQTSLSSGITNSSNAHGMPYQAAPCGSSLYSGMKSESLHLPALDDVAIHQQGHLSVLPPLRNEGRPANISALPDMSARPPSISNALSLARDPKDSDSPLQPLPPVLPSLRPGISSSSSPSPSSGGLPRSTSGATRPLDPSSGLPRPDEDRLAFLADVAHADQGRHRHRSDYR